MGERDFIWWERLYSTSCHKLNLSASWCLTLSTSWLSQNQNQTRHEGFLVIAQQRLKKFGITSRSSRQLQQNSHLSFFRSYPKNISSRFVTLFSCFSSRRRHRERERETMAFRGVASWRAARRSSGLGARWMSTWWRSVEPAPKDPILGVTEAFLADPSPNKVNVGVVSSFLLSKISLFGR